VISRFHLTAVEKRYGNQLALRVRELTIRPGRLYILFGPNGSGKSTLLNILAFLTKPELGEVMFDGKPVAWKREELQLLRKRVTLLHQSPYLFGDTVAFNVGYGLKIRGVAGRQLERAVAEALELVGLGGFEQRHVQQLSGGEARRAALARALAVKPDILLLDEPLANVDEESAKVAERLIASLPAQGTTVVMSTHDPHQGSRMEGEIIRLQDGALVAIDSRFSPPALANEASGVPAETCGGFHGEEVTKCQPLKRHARSFSAMSSRWGLSAWRFWNRWVGSSPKT
jgi:tungstate transport system ATP-binding protein